MGPLPLPLSLSLENHVLYTSLPSGQKPPFRTATKFNSFLVRTVNTRYIKITRFIYWIDHTAPHLDVLAVLEPDQDVGDLAQSVEPEVDVHHLETKQRRQEHRRGAQQGGPVRRNEHPTTGAQRGTVNLPTSQAGWMDCKTTGGVRRRCLRPGFFTISPVGRNNPQTQPCARTYLVTDAVTRVAAQREQPADGQS